VPPRHVAGWPYFITKTIIMFVFLIFTELSAFAVHTRDMYYVSVEFKHKFHFETNQSVTMKEIAAGMFAEIHNRTNKFVALSDWISFAFSFFFLIMLFK
jgi:hypothetical protein